MDALAKNEENKKRGIVQMLKAAYGAFIGMINFEGDVEETLAEVTKGENENPETAKIIEALAYEEKMLSQRVQEQFDTSKTFKIGPEKENSGEYHEIENKLKGIEAKVSEEEARNQMNSRQQGGRQKTRADED